MMQRKDFDFAPVSKRIREAREEKHVTQEEAAHACGCGFRHLGAIERNESNPSIGLLVRMSSYYNKTVDHFLQDSPDISDVYLDEEIAVLLNQLNKKNKKIAIEFLKTLNEIQNQNDSDSDEDE